MKRKDRFELIKGYISINGPVDILNAEFVEYYIDSTDANFVAMKYGAFKCPQLGKDLADMRVYRMLTRARIGLPGLGQGFPKWVYSYRLAE